MANLRLAGAKGDDVNERGEWWILSSCEAREGRRAASKMLGRYGRYGGRMPQADFADLLGVSRRTIIRAEQRGIDFFRTSIRKETWQKVTGLDLRVLPRRSRK